MRSIGTARHVLVDEDGIAVGIDDDEARRSAAILVSLGLRLDPGRLEAALME